ncbi:hypothetical protein [Flavisphingomonas formosensis]|uniref:hypothetical protein n=1 Tax=Flavisphingomonas formosensis TaxID=861534 RepID=UPI0012F97724|nr:hypothetical protein [Sphingomonas formosensis]
MTQGSLARRREATADDAWQPSARIIVGTLLLVALALRIAAARGGLWLDEAWSARFAHDARTPAAVFFSINHDNNHYLNTLWLQLVGWDSPPLLARALAIACGTASVAAAAWIGARRSPHQAIILALLFAISPIMLTYGAEARGYGPMLLALLIAIGVVDRDVSGRPLPGAGRMLGYAGLFGMLAHLAMLPGLLALTAWALVARLNQRLPLPAAIAGALRLMQGALAAAIGLLAVMILAARASPAGYRIGSYQPFYLPKLLDGLEQMIAFSFGLGFVPDTLLLVAAAIALPLALWRVPAIRDRAPFLILAIYALPLAALFLRLGNSGIPRYYLIVSVALLLLAGELLAAAWRAGGWRRTIAAAALAGFTLTSIALDARIIAGRRGDPDRAIAAMAARAPQGGSVLIDDSRDEAVLAAAAARLRYPLAVSQRECARPRFLFKEMDDVVPFPPRPIRCGTPYRRLASGHSIGLSGVNWQLYERESKLGDM